MIIFKSVSLGAEKSISPKNSECQKYAEHSWKYTIMFETREGIIMPGQSLTLWGGSDTFWPKPWLATTYNLLQSLPSPVSGPVLPGWLAWGNLADPENVRPTDYWINLFVSRTVTASFMDTPNLIILGPTIQLDRQLISPSPQHQHQGCIPLFADSLINKHLVKYRQLN